MKPEELAAHLKLIYDGPWRAYADPEAGDGRVHLVGPGNEHVAIVRRPEEAHAISLMRQSFPLLLRLWEAAEVLEGGDLECERAAGKSGLSEALEALREYRP